MKIYKIEAFFTFKVKFDMDEETLEYVDDVDILRYVRKQVLGQKSDSVDIEYCNLVNFHVDGKSIDNEDFKMLKETVNK